MTELLEALTDLSRSDTDDVIAVLQRFAPEGFFVIAPTDIRIDQIAPAPTNTGLLKRTGLTLLRMLTPISELLCFYQLSNGEAAATATDCSSKSLNVSGLSPLAVTRLALGHDPAMPTNNRIKELLDGMAGGAMIVLANAPGRFFPGVAMLAARLT